MLYTIGRSVRLGTGPFVGRSVCQTNERWPKTDEIKHKLQNNDPFRMCYFCHETETGAHTMPSIMCTGCCIFVSHFFACPTVRTDGHFWIRYANLMYYNIQEHLQSATKMLRPVFQSFAKHWTEQWAFTYIHVPCVYPNTLTQIHICTITNVCICTHAHSVCACNIHWQATTQAVGPNKKRHTDNSKRSLRFGTECE